MTGGTGNRRDRPPRLAQALLAASLPPDAREWVVGDLAEEYARRVEEGRGRPRLWYWSQVLRSVAPGVGRRLTRRRVRFDEGTHGRRGTMMTGILKDLRLALRQLHRNPVFSAVVVLTLAVGIGANTVIFSAVDGVVLNPFPYPEPDRLVGVGSAYPRIGAEMGFWEAISPAEFEDVREQTRTLEDVVAWDMGFRQIAGATSTESVFTAFWWGDAFETLRMEPVVGRGFTEEEIREGARAAIVSHRLWSSRFGGDPSVVGRSVAVNGEPYTLVGVMPPGTLIYGTDLWTPMPVSPSAYPRNRRQFNILARVRPGVTLEEANAELEAVARRTEQTYAAEFEEYAGWRMEARTWTEVNVQILRPVATILMGAVGFVLLLVCANLAGLLLARAAGRRREVAVRRALGAGRVRIVREFLVQSLVLALVGGAVGAGLAVLGVRGLEAFLSTLTVPVPGEVALSHRALLFTAGISLLAGVLLGLAPALHGSRSEVQESLQAEGRSATGSRSRLRLQRTLVGVEVALALALLGGAGLLVHSYLKLNAVEPGVEAESVLTMRLTLPWERYEAPEMVAFFDELVRRVEALPGVRSAAAGSQFPPITFSSLRFTLEGTIPAPDETLPSAFATTVTAGYFETLGIPVRRGRPLEEAVSGAGGIVGLVNEAAARRFFPGQDPVGRRLKTGDVDSESPWVEIVGVVASTRNRGLDTEPQPEIFALYEQIPESNQLFLLVRAEGDARSVLPAVRRAVRELDAEQPVYAIQTVEEAYATRSAPRRVTALLLAFFAAFALVLAAVGIYAVVSYSVNERTREIGLRVALGAESGTVRRLVVRQAMLPVAVGGVVGLGLALLVGAALSGFLFQISGHDPLTLASVVLAFGAVALAASYLPARRASRLDPVKALRRE